MKAAATLFLFFVVNAARSRPALGDPVCTDGDARIVVDLEEHKLALCEQAKLVESFGVRLGHSGIGKTRAGDGKTPVGTYPLGQPRASQRYGIFIPIGYPTVEQRKKGYTGGAVGVHGPDRRVKWLGRLVNTFDTSNGCIGLAKDEEMERIAKWVRSAKARTIDLR